MRCGQNVIRRSKQHKNVNNNVRKMFWLCLKVSKILNTLKTIGKICVSVNSTFYPMFCKKSWHTAWNSKSAIIGLIIGNKQGIPSVFDVSDKSAKIGGIFCQKCKNGKMVKKKEIWMFVL